MLYYVHTRLQALLVVLIMNIVAICSMAKVMTLIIHLMSGKSDNRVENGCPRLKSMTFQLSSLELDNSINERFEVASSATTVNDKETWT